MEEQRVTGAEQQQMQDAGRPQRAAAWESTELGPVSAAGVTSELVGRFMEAREARDAARDEADRLGEEYRVVEEELWRTMDGHGVKSFKDADGNLLMATYRVYPGLDKEVVDVDDPAAVAAALAAIERWLGSVELPDPETGQMVNGLEYCRVPEKVSLARLGHKRVLEYLNDSSVPQPEALDLHPRPSISVAKGKSRG